MSDEHRRRWEAVAAWPLILAAVVFLAAYAWPILDDDLSPAGRSACGVVLAAVWIVFAVDYVVRLALASHRGRFVRAHPLDLASVVLPLLRPLQLLRLVRALTVLERRLGERLQQRVAYYTASVTSLLIVVGSLAVLDAEQDSAGANITGFGDAVWWAFTTVTTVGYGDLYPVTGSGRAVAVGLMLGGIALLGVVTGTLASSLTHRFEETDEAAQAATRRDVEALTEEVRRLRAELAGQEPRRR